VCETFLSNVSKVVQLHTVLSGTVNVGDFMLTNSALQTWLQISNLAEEIINATKSKLIRKIDNILYCKSYIE